jgi:hypothetical protein
MAALNRVPRLLLLIRLAETTLKVVPLKNTDKK